MIDEKQAVAIANEYVQKMSGVTLPLIGASLQTDYQDLYGAPTWCVWFRYLNPSIEGQRIVNVDANTGEAWERRNYPDDFIYEEEAVNIAKSYMQRFSDKLAIFIDTAFNPNDFPDNVNQSPTWSVFFKVVESDSEIQHTVIVNAETGEPSGMHDVRVGDLKHTLPIL